MGFFDSLFGKSSDSSDEIYLTIDTERLKDIVRDTLPIKDEQQLEKVVESIRSSLVPLNENAIDKIGEVVTETLSELYEVGGYNRIHLCKQVDEFVRANPEIANSIKLIASYIAYGASDVNIEDYKAIIVSESEDIKEKAFEKIEKFECESGIKRLIYRLAQDLVKYEDAFLEKIRNKDGKVVGVKYLPSNSIIIQVDPVTGKPIKYYQVISPDEIKYVDEQNIFTSINKYTLEKKVIEFDPDDIVHINNGSPIGLSDSPILSIAILWRFLRLLEESLVIHRVTRARRFIIFFLDVTGKTRDKVRSAINSFTAMLKRIFSIDVDSGSVISRNSIVQAATDLVIPITKDSATKVQTIPSDPSATKIEDLKFYTNRLLTNFMTGWIFYPERTGKEEIQKEAFIRLVKIYQKHFSYALTDLYREYLKERGFTSNVVTVKIQFPNPDTQQEAKVIDIVVRRMVVVNQITAIMGVTPPIRWIVSYVFRDLSQIEVDELVSLIEQELKKQEEKAKGQELPSIFEKVTDGDSERSILDQIVALAEHYEDEHSGEEGQLEPIREKAGTTTFQQTLSTKDAEFRRKGYDLFEARAKVIEQSLRYLDLIGSKK